MKSLSRPCLILKGVNFDGLIGDLDENLPFSFPQFSLFLNMGAPKTKTHFTPAEYLAMEALADYKSEYYNGEIFAMSGGTVEHSRITMDCARTLADAMGNQPCELFSNDLKIRIESSSSYYYPELSAVCGPPKFEDPKKTILTNPVLIVEVLSESTESFDRGKKFHRYQQISTLREYVLIAQSEAQIDVFYKGENGIWMLHSYAGMDAVMKLQSLKIDVKLSDIYRRVEFEAEISA